MDVSAPGSPGAVRLRLRPGNAKRIYTRDSTRIVEFEWAKKANRGNVKVRIDAPYLRVYPPPQVDSVFCP
jgi:hypothetical protein